MDNETVTCSQEDFEIVASDANMMTIVAATVEDSQEGIILGSEIVNDSTEEITNSNLPVTLVVSEPSVLAHINENVNMGSCSQEEPVISTVSLQNGDTNAQYFIEHIASNGSQIQCAESGTIQTEVNPTENMENQDCVPILLHVSEDGISSRQTEIHIPQTEGNDHMSLSTTLGTDDMPETMYTIHLTEDQPPEGIISDEHGTLTTSNADLTAVGPPSTHLEHVTLSDESNLHFLATSNRLEDFMDVVTTYKCKFCRFSCAWKSGLMSHIRSCHLETTVLPVTQSNNSTEQLRNLALKQNTNETVNGDKKTAKVDVNSTASDNKESIILLDPSNTQAKSNDINCINDSNDLELTPSNSTSPPPPPQERHIFLCGQCSKGFNSLEGCKQHMIKDHSLKMGTPKQSRSKSRGRPRVTPALNSSNCILDDDDEEEDDYNDDAVETDVDNNNFEGTCREDNDDLSESSGKRRIRPPRALEEDYYLGTKKKRVRRQSMTDRTFRCNEKGCGYRFTTEANLHYHARCHTAGDKPFTCPECREKCDHWRGLVLHLWKQHCVDMDLHTCPICGYKTFSLFKLDNHKRIHSDEREFICTTCGKGFKQLSQLRNHNVIHLDRKNLSEKRWYSEQECDICHRTFSDSKCLRKHQQAVHNKLKPYVCSYCGHMSARKAMLQLHMRQHTGEKPFKCDHCDYRTGDHNSLRRHRMRHTGKKPYRCPHCSYACIQAISYKMHLKNKHPGMEGLYACSLCTFRSVSKENYINHMSDHKRGVVQAASTSNFHTNNNCNEQNTLANEDGNDSQTVQESAQLHVTEGTLQQLEGILPGNLSAAQFICSCLSALGQDGGTINLPAGITTTTTARDGTQTITIQLPAAAQENLEQEQFYLTIQHQDSSTPTTIITPNIGIQDVHTVATSDTTDNLAILQPIITQQGDNGQPIDNSTFVTADGDSATVVIASNADIPTETESATSLLQEVSPC